MVHNLHRSKFPTVFSSILVSEDEQHFQVILPFQVQSLLPHRDHDHDGDGAYTLALPHIDCRDNAHVHDFDSSHDDYYTLQQQMEVVHYDAGKYSSHPLCLQKSSHFLSKRDVYLYPTQRIFLAVPPSNENVVYL